MSSLTTSRKSWCRGRRLAVGISVALGLAACGSQARPGGGSNLSMSPAEVSFVIASTEPNEGASAQQQVISSAETALIKTCMAAAGFDYAAPPIPRSTIPLATTNPLGSDEQAAITSTAEPTPEADVLQERGSNGYGMYAYALVRHQPLSPPPVNPVYASLSKSEQARWTRVLDGRPESTVVKLPAGGQYTSGLNPRGCYGRALTHLYGSVTTAENVGYVPQQLDNDLNEQVSAAAPVVAALTKWSSCMSTRYGEELATPSAARAAAIKLYMGGSVNAAVIDAKRPEEVALATEDARCAYSTGLMNAYAQAFTNAVHHLSAAEYGAVLAATNSQMRAEQRAASLLQK